MTITKKPWHRVARAVRVITAVVFASIVLAFSSFAVPGDGGNLQPPNKETRRASMAKVREIFAGDMAKATTAEAKAKLAKELLGHARETSIPNDQYALLEAANSFAMDAGDVDLVLESLAMVADRFAIDLPAARADALRKLAKEAPPASLGRVVDLLLESAEQDTGSVGAVSGEEAAELSLSAARRAKDRERQQKASEKLGEIRARRKLLSRVKPLEEKLAANPADRDAAAELGRFRCFVEGDWEAGLPLLSRGNDAHLAALAMLEINLENDGAGRMALADKWWDYAALVKGAESAAAESRARQHYGMILEDLSGLERARVVKRLESAASGTSGSAKRPSGLILWLDASAPGAVRGLDGQPIQLKKGVKDVPAAAWADMPTGRPTAIQQTNPSRSPVFTAEAFGNRPGVVFRGGQCLVTDVASPKQGSLAVVFRVDSTQTHTRLIGTVGESAGVRLQTRIGGMVGGEVSSGGHGGEGVGSPDGYLRDRMAVIAILRWPAPFRLSLNGKAIDAPKPCLVIPAGGKGLVLGAFDDKCVLGFQGAIGEVMLFDRVLSAAETAGLHASLAAKWGVR